MIRDIRTALRGFRRTPAFSLTAILTLAVGIGMAVAMFTVYDTVLRRDLPIRDADRVVVLWTHRGDSTLEVSGPFQKLEDEFRPVSKTLSDVAGVAHWGAVPTPFLDGDNPIVLNRTLVSANFFDVLGATPVVGRFLRRDDQGIGPTRAMVISFGTWQRRFGGDSSIVGKQISDAYSASHFTIVGVAPSGIEYPAGVEAWTLPWNSGIGAYAVGRLAPGVSSAVARAEYFSVEQRVLPAFLHIVGAAVSSLSDSIRGNVRSVMAVLAGAVTLLLLIACVNIGNLLLLRAASREREIAIRRALGASFGSIARQLTVESALLGLAGGALGLLCARFVLKLIVAFAPARLPRLDELRVESPSIVVAAAVMLIAVMIFGVAPSLSAARSKSLTSLRLDARGGTETRRRRQIRYALVASQVALALTLLAGAGLLSKSLQRLTQIDLGYTPEHLAVVQVAWQSPIQKELISTGEALLQRYRSIPGVVAATPVLIPPFIGANVFHGQVFTEGQSQAEHDRAPSVPVEVADEEYFRTMGIPIVRGRGLLQSDREGAPSIAVVSEAIAHKLWPGADPIGKRIAYWGPDSTSWRTVVGVARDIRFRSLRDATPTIYLPWRQTTVWQLCFAIRTSTSLASLSNAIRRETRAVSASLNVWDSEDMNDYLAGPLAQPRLSAFLMAGFGFVALLLASLGLYGVMSQSVRDQTRELGVRMALGATPGRVRRDVLGRAATVTLAGAAAGFGLVFACSRLLSSLLFEMSPADPLTLAGASAVLFVVALAAAYIPARRATKINPIAALRGDS